MIKTLAAAAVFICATTSGLLAEPKTDQNNESKAPIEVDGVQPAPDVLHVEQSSDSDEELPDIVVVLSERNKTSSTTQAVSSKPQAPVVEKAALTDKEKLQAERRARLNRDALACRGTRYVWGGSTRSGFDCSGFTQYLYARRGVKLPHSAKQQFKMGKPVSKADLKEGDLVFFNTTGPISHVGMYIGNGKFIHAANRRRGVTVDRLDTAYYQKRYAGARRYL